MNDKIKINEIFYSIDGEGARVGFPAVFVRLTGCNLRCNYCDTKYAFEEYSEMSISDIISEVKKYDCKNITLTGGEPLLQENTIKLLECFYNEDMNVIVETNGAIDIGKAQDFAFICMDWKVPSSMMEEKMLESNLLKLKHHDILKMVVRQRDLTYVKEFLNKWKLDCDIYLSPVFNEIELPVLVEFVKNYRGKNNLRVQLQIHKFIWNPDERGV